MSQGDVCHTEYPSTDLQASKTLYTTASGWSFQDIPGMEDYALSSTAGGQQGGFSGGKRAGAPTDKGPIAPIEVGDIDAVLIRINQLGGRTVMPKTKISGPFGSDALSPDNVGNRLGLWGPT